MDTNEKEGPSHMVRKIGSILVNFDCVEWVQRRVSEQTGEPVYTFHFVSGYQAEVIESPPIRLDIEMALAKWQGIPIDPTNNQTVEIPAIRKTNFLQF